MSRCHGRRVSASGEFRNAEGLNWWGLLHDICIDSESLVTIGCVSISGARFQTYWIYRSIFMERYYARAFDFSQDKLS
jgi:hypothetical protein